MVSKISRGATRVDLARRVAELRDARRQAAADVAVKHVADLMRMHVHEGYKAGGETARKCREYVLDRVLDNPKSALSQLAADVSYGIGVVTYIRPPATVDDMLVKADHMLYAAKREGKNKVRFLVWKESAMVR